MNTIGLIVSITVTDALFVIKFPLASVIVTATVFNPKLVQLKLF